MNGIFVTKNHKCNFYAYEEHLVQMKKARFAQRKAEEEAMAQDAFEHSKGYCPHCGGLIALNGTCTICGYEK